MQANSKNPGEESKPDVTVKSWGGWQSLSGGMGGYTDEYGRPDPSTNDLIGSVRDIAYSCISIIANNLSKHRLKLYIETPEGRLLPKCRKPDVKARINFKSRLLNSNVQEVVSHPALDLLYKSDGEHTALEVFKLVFFALEACGNAYLYKKRDAFGVMESLVFLPVDRITIVRDDDTGLIRGYKFGPGVNQKFIKRNDICHLKYPNIGDPYGYGFSPLQACYNRILISFQQAGYLSATLRNNARPDAVLSAADYSIGVNEAERLQKEFNQVYKLAGSGGIIVTSDKMSLQPLSWSPTDLGLDQLYQSLKISILNSFCIPQDIFDSTNSNRATAETAQYSFAVNCLAPRLAYLVEKLTQCIASEFDDRLFFYTDDIIPEDKEYELKKYDTLLKNGVITRNEWREVLGLDSERWAEEPLIPAGFTTEEQLEAQRLASLPPVAPPPAPIPEPTETTDDKVKLASTLSTMAQSVAAGQLPAESAIAIASVLGVSAEQARLLFPEPKQPERQEQQQLPSQTLPDAPQAPQEDEGGSESTQVETASEERSEKARKERRTLPMISGEEDPTLTLAIKTFFRRLAYEAEENVKMVKNFSTKAPDDEPPLFNAEMAQQDLFDLTIPRIRLLYDSAAKQASSYFEQGNNLFKVAQKRLEEAVQQATMEFAASTVATTTLEIEAAKAELRKELEQGLSQGEYKNQLRERVQKVFSNADNERAYLISHTEANRAVHGAQMIVAQESGQVKAARWLCDANACDHCRELDGMEVPLGQNFITVGIGSYSQVKHPPRHPACRCTMLLVLGD